MRNHFVSTGFVFVFFFLDSNIWFYPRPLAYLQVLSLLIGVGYGFYLMELAVSQTRLVGLVTPTSFAPPLHYRILEDAVFLELFLEYSFFLCSSTL